MRSDTCINRCLCPVIISQSQPDSSYAGHFLFWSLQNANDPLNSAASVAVIWRHLPVVESSESSFLAFSADQIAIVANDDLV